MALKSILAAAFVAVTMAFVPVPAAEAKTKIIIGIGHNAGPCLNRSGRRCGWRPRVHHYHYLPRHRSVYYYYNDNRRPALHRMSCSRARSLVASSGFHKVKTRDCTGKYYSFKALRKGHYYLVRVNAVSRRIVGSKRI